MKDFKYFVIFGISLAICVYVVGFMPSVQLLEDHSHEHWFSEAENLTEFYLEGVQGTEKIEQIYDGNILFSDLKMQLDISIGKMQELHSKLANNQEVYEANKMQLYSDFGILNYIEYDMLCDSMKEIFDKNENDKVLSANIVENSINQNDFGDIFEVQIIYTSGNSQRLVVTFYNEEQELLNKQEQEGILPTILKIMPKVEG